MSRAVVAVSAEHDDTQKRSCLHRSGRFDD